MARRDVIFMAVGVAVAALLFGAYRLVMAPATPVAAPPLSAALPPAAATASSSAPKPASPLAIPPVAEMTAKLAARLEKSGGTPADWQLLGKSYEFLGQTAQATAAFARAGAKPADSAAIAAPLAAPIAAPIAASGATTRVTGTVEVAPGVRARLPAEAILFVLAKSALLTGPPLAVIKIPAKRWPVTFQLDDSNAMMPAANLSSAEKVIVEARVSLSGNPIAQPGDLAGSLPAIDPRKARPLRVVIDHLVR